MIYLNC